MNQTVCRVHLLDLPFHADRPFDYFIPQGMSPRVGDFVLVPFGGGNRTSVALVTALAEAEQGRKLKPLHSVIYPEYSLDEGTIALIRFLSDRTLCSYGEAAKAIMPVHSFAGAKDIYFAAEGARGTGELFDLIRSNPGITRSRIEKKLGKDALKELRSLVSSGAVVMHAKLTAQNRKYKETVSLAGDATELLEKIGKCSKKRIAVIEFLRDNGPVAFELLREDFSLTRAGLRDLVDMGAVRVEVTDSYRTPYEGDAVKEEVRLSPEQSRARDILCDLADSGEAKAALLYGVTGSGKTQVIRAVMDHVIASGRGVIMLVPEISLTPQTVG
ncbi:MAG: DEAD/DEAH box helicase family protein, partial [Clostridia bacterium]|nr:DEAD/DEAH box helicase family protein [Clostridia bacterium]